MSKLKISAEHSYTIGQVFFVHPADIVADQSLNTRHTPHDAESVAEMVSTLREQGQIQPVAARKTRDGKLHLVAGFRRHAAALQIVETDPEFRLKVVILDVNDEEAFQRNLAENLERRELSPIDIATAQRRCAEQYGWDGKRIATFFRMSQSYVSQHKKLLGLSAKIQKQVHEGKITISGALELAKVDTETAEEIADANAIEEPGEGKRTGSTRRIRDAVSPTPRKRKEPEADTSDAPGYPGSVTIKDVDILFANLNVISEEGSLLNKVCNVVIAFVNGKKSSHEAEDALQELLN